jgi:hypothetical protein
LPNSDLALVSKRCKHTGCQCSDNDAINDRLYDVLNLLISSLFLSDSNVSRNPSSSPVSAAALPCYP